MKTRILNKRNTFGMSIMEMMIALFLTSIVVSSMFLLWRTVGRITYTEKLCEELKGDAQRATRLLEADLIRAKKFFNRGSPFESLIPSANMPVCLSFSKLPQLKTLGVFDPASSDFDGSIFGNKLFFAKIENSANFKVGTLSYDFNLYRLVYYYLAKDSSIIVKPKKFGYYVVRWESAPFADYWELEHVWADSLIAHPKTAIKETLKNRFKTIYCWNVASSKTDSAFYTIGSYSTPVKLTEFPTGDLRTMMRASLYPYTVSFNKSASFPVKENVPGFATADGDFPTGLEFGVVGPSSSRKVLVRIVLAGWSTKQLISYNSTTIVSAPEY